MFAGAVTKAVILELQGSAKPIGPGKTIDSGIGVAVTSHIEDAGVFRRSVYEMEEG